MRDARLVLLFERYRSAGDAGALAKVFDQVSPGLLKVARHIDGRAGEAEDLVQTTFLVAIERAASFDAQRPLVPWLMGILINQSRLARRRRSKTDDDLAVAKSSDSDVGLELENREFATAVVKALRDLPETYQEVLVPHLTQGLKPREIAQLLGRPHGTVRAQLHRGIRLMRKLLPAGFAAGATAMVADRSGWASSSWEQAREAVLAHARQAAQRQGLNSSPAAKLVRLPTPTSIPKAGLAAFAIMLALGLWMWMQRERGGDSVRVAQQDRTQAPPSATQALGTHEREPRVRTAIEPLDRAQPVVDAASPFGEVVLYVRGAKDHKPAPGHQVTALAWGDPQWYAHVMEAVTDAEGKAVLTHVHVGRVGLHVDHGKQLRFDVLAGQRTVCEAELPRGLDVHGRVVDGEGNGIAGARIDLLERTALRGLASGQTWDAQCTRSAELAQGAITRADGSFDLADVARTRLVRAQSAGRACSELFALDAPRYRELDQIELKIVLARSAAPWVGQVVDAQMNPVADACVTAWHVDALPAASSAEPSARTAAHSGARNTDAAAEDHAHADASEDSSAHSRFHMRCCADGSLRIEVACVQAISDAQGRFALDATPAGGLEAHVTAADFAPWSASFDGDDPQRKIVAHLSTGARLQGRVRLHDGSNAEGASVKIRASDDQAEQTTHTGPEGDYAFDHVLAGAIVLSARAHGVGPPTAIPLHLMPGETSKCDAIVEPEQVIRGRVIGQDHRPVSLWLVRAFPEEELDQSHDLPLERWLERNWLRDDANDLLQCWTDPQGHFSVPARGQGPHRLELRPRTAWTSGPQGSLSGVQPGAHDVVLRYEPNDAWMRGHVASSNDGHASPCELIAFHMSQGTESHFESDPLTGSFALGPLPEGRYEVVAWPEGSVPKRLGTFELPRGEALEIGSFTLAHEQ